MIKKTYSELMKLDNFIDRYNYLKIGGGVAEQTFGGYRYLNQQLLQFFYHFQYFQ